MESIVEFRNDVPETLICELIKASFFRKVLPEEPIGVLVGPALPW